MKVKLLLLLCAVFCICACQSTSSKAKEIQNNIVFALGPKYNPDNWEQFVDYNIDDCNYRFDDLTAREIDVRYCDITRVNFEALPEDIINRMSFNDKTFWPFKMPIGVDLSKVLKEIDKKGKTPGLNIKKLHKKGITGKGVSIAIIDQPLSYHNEYKDNVVYYKNLTKQDVGSMHGAAVASIAVGKNVGVAPGARLFFVATEFKVDNKRIFDAAPVAKAINYILELNKTLPEKDKISVISISRGFSLLDRNIQDYQAAKAKAKKQDILVLATDDVMTVSRNGYFADPDNLESYTNPPYWFKDKDMSFIEKDKEVFVPTDYRITACETGKDTYAYYAAGGLSWGVPYLAGVAALAKQVKPELDMEQFIPLVLETADTVTVKDSKGKEYSTKYFISPTRLIEKLKEKKKKK